MFYNTHKDVFVHSYVSKVCIVFENILSNFSIVSGKSHVLQTLNKLVKMNNT